MGATSKKTVAAAKRSERLKVQVLAAYFALDHIERRQVRDFIARGSADDMLLKILSEVGHEVTRRHVTELKRMVVDEQINEFTDLICAAAQVSRRYFPYRKFTYFSGSRYKPELEPNTEWRDPAECLDERPSVYPILAAYFETPKCDRKGFRAFLSNAHTGATVAIALREAGYDVGWAQVDEFWRQLESGELQLPDGEVKPRPDWYWSMRA